MPRMCEAQGLIASAENTLQKACGPEEEASSTCGVCRGGPGWHKASVGKPGSERWVCLPAHVRVEARCWLLHLPVSSVL